MNTRVQHGATIDSERKRLYNIWRGMRQRCTNPKATSYIDYGGRGISVDSDWDTFPAFQEWALSNGYQTHLSIERRDVNLSYQASNCYWADNTIQACNKRKRTGKTSAFIGVAPNRDRWQAYVDYKGKRINLGTYDSTQEAAVVRDDYVKTNNLPHKLNF